METEPTTQRTQEALGLSDLWQFLLGSREAILRVSASRAALGLGALFCVSAGLAREYDGEDLLHDPWYVAIPLAASLATSALLYLMLYGCCRLRAHQRPPLVGGYLGFLAMYWMTAPLAWLYALPVERFLSPGDAMGANLTLLLLVSVGRVALMTRCSAVYFGSRHRDTFFIVLLFADVLALVIIYFTPLPILNIMGGVRLSEGEQVLLSTALAVQALGVATLPVWFIGACVIAAGKSPWNPPNDWSESPGPRVGRGLWGLAAAAIVVGLAVLPFTQPALQNQRQVLETFERGDIETAVAEMTRYGTEGLPISFDPPPWLSRDLNEPPLTKVLQEIQRQQAPDWIRERYLAKLEDSDDDGFLFWRGVSDKDLDIYHLLMGTMPGFAESLPGGVAALDIHLSYADDSMPDERRALLEGIRDKWKALAEEPSEAE